MSELLIGHSPFLRTANENPTETEICRRILENEPDLVKIRLLNGENMSAIERFIQSLLIKDPTQRLGKLNVLFCLIRSYVYSFDSVLFSLQGTGQNGFEAIKSHEFFR